MRKRRTAKEKELEDNTKLLRAWKKFHRAERDAVLVGPHGAALSEFFRMLENLQHVQPSQLIGFVSAIDWSMIDYGVKLTVLHELNVAITAFRVKRGAEPINDNLPGEPDTPFRTIKAIIFPHVTHVAPAEAQLGSGIETPSKMEPVS